MNGFRLGVQVDPQPQILVAALRQGMLRLAGREGDGAIINWLSADDVKKVAPYVTRVGADKEIVARIFVAPNPNTEQVRGMAKFAIAAYLNVPVYAAFHEWLGRGPKLAGMWEAWKKGDRKAAVAAIPDEVVDELIVHGTPEQCRAHIQRYVDAGVDTPGARDPAARRRRAPGDARPRAEIDSEGKEIQHGRCRSSRSTPSLGKLKPEKLGKTLMHEHVMVGYPGWEADWVRPTRSKREMRKIAADKIAEMKDEGIKTMIDPCPADLGRDIEFIAEVASKAKFNIVAATGLYHEHEGGSPHWKSRTAFGGPQENFDGRDDDRRAHRRRRQERASRRASSRSRPAPA